MTEEVKKAKRTVAEKLEAARALVAKYEAILNGDSIATNIEKGDQVEFTFGRKDKKRQLAGVVQGIRVEDNGNRTIAILTGEDVDIQIVKVYINAITRNVTAEAREAEQPADEAVDPLVEA